MPSAAPPLVQSVMADEDLFLEQLKTGQGENLLLLSIDRVLLLVLSRCMMEIFFKESMT